MSRARDNKEKITKKNKKNGTLFYSEVIQYSDDELYHLMKKGYIDMGEINLKLAIENGNELGDINKYETWLCGV